MPNFKLVMLAVELSNIDSGYVRVAGFLFGQDEAHVYSKATKLNGLNAED